MSGPKVVRIVTRDEVIAICEGHLVRLEAALDEWRRIGRRNDTLTDADIAQAESRRDALRRLLANESFLELQKRVPLEIARLASDTEDRLARAAAAAAEERTARRRTQSAAQSVLNALVRAGVTVPPGLRCDLQHAADGHESEASGAAITRAFTLLSPTGGGAEVSEHQRQIASALKASDDKQTYRQWVAMQLPQAEDGVLVRLETQIAQLTVTLGGAVSAEFEIRLQAVAAAPMSRRALLLDSLEIDLARAVSEARERLALQGRVRMLAAELKHMQSSECTEAARSISAQIESPVIDLVTLEADARRVLEQARERVAAAARRHAVLAGLAQLGYQVTDGLETAWVQDGRVVLRKPAQPGYGLEVGGGIQSVRMQMRAVAFRGASSPVDSARDLDAETMWCSELSELESQLARTGGGIVIEHKSPVGATPLKVITEPPTEETTSAATAPAARTRQLNERA